MLNHRARHQGNKYNGFITRCTRNGEPHFTLGSYRTAPGHGHADGCANSKHGLACMYVYSTALILVLQLVLM